MLGAQQRKLSVQLNRALMTIIKNREKNVFFMYNALCAQQVQPSLQALSEKCARVSLSGHSSLVALCLPVLSQGGH